MEETGNKYFENQNIESNRLSNGTLVITEQIPHMKSVSLGFWVKVGSRDEKIKFVCARFILIKMQYYAGKLVI